MSAQQAFRQPSRSPFWEQGLVEAFSRSTVWVPILVAFISGGTVFSISRSLGHADGTIAVSLGGIASLVFLWMGLAAQYQKRSAAALLTQTRSSEDLGELSGAEFLTVVSEVYRRRGYVVRPAVRGTDIGVDLILVRREEQVFVHCRRWKSKQVGEKLLRDLYALTQEASNASGLVVTTGTFTPEALRFARSAGIAAVEGGALVAMVDALVGRVPVPN